MSDAKASNPEIIFPEPGEVQIRNAEPGPLGPDEVRIRTRSSLISAGTEGASYSGQPWTRPDGKQMPTYPATPGYSNAGVVVEIGAEVDRFEVGDRVASTAGHRLHNTFAQTRDNLWHVPESVSDDEATFCVLGCTVLNGVRLGHPQIGEDVAVVGLGVLGQLACRYLSLSGASHVIGIDLDEHRLDLARRAGAVTDALNPCECDVAEAVRELTDGRDADIVFEVTGRTETFDMCFDLARRMGTVVALGSPRWPAEVDMMKVHLRALEVVGAIVSSHPKPGDERNRWHRHANGELFMELVASGALDVESMITHRFDYTDAVEAYPTALGDREPALGVIFEW